MGCAVGLVTAHAVQPPNTVCFSVATPGVLGESSYLDVTIQTDGPLLLDGWCVDTDTGILPDRVYTARVYSLGDPEVAGFFDVPAALDNLDLVLYILNQDYPGKTAPNGTLYTYGDVQRAIWTLVEDEQATGGLGSWRQVRVDAILADAALNGEGFTPGYGDTTILFLNPVAEGCDLETSNTETIAQIIIVEVPLPPTNPGTGTPGYWKNHPAAWPVDFITIGGITYTKAEAIARLGWPDGDKRNTLFRALVCATLNVLIGNDNSCIADTLEAGNLWWATYSGGRVAANSAAWQLGEPIAWMLDAYNNGLLCAPARD
jgi:hypothetical protein